MSEQEKAASFTWEIGKAAAISLILPLLLIIFYGVAPYWLIHTLHSPELDQLDIPSKIWDQSPQTQGLRDWLTRYDLLVPLRALSCSFYISCGLMATILGGQALILGLNFLVRKNHSLLLIGYQTAWYITLTIAVLNLFLLIPLLAYCSFELPVLLTGSFSIKIIALIVIGGICVLVLSISLLTNPILLEFHEPMSKSLLKEDAPGLWNTVTEAARRLNTPPPDFIISGLQFNCYVTELTVIHDGGRTQGRTLYLSYPLMTVLSQKELMAIIGHELGHFIGKDTTLTRKFYPLRRKVTGTLATMRSGGVLGISSLYIISFFYYVFESTCMTLARKREFAADAVGASLTTAEVTAEALVKTHVFAEAFNIAFNDYLKDKKTNPINVNLNDLVRTKLFYEVSFWDDLFNRIQQHPLDSHPTLHDRLRELGQNPSPNYAKRLFIANQPTEVQVVPQAAIFEEIKQQAQIHIEKVQGTATLASANYDTAEGKELLDRHFPPVTWTGKPVYDGGVFIFLAFFVMFMGLAAISDSNMLWLGYCVIAIGTGVVGFGIYRLYTQSFKPQSLTLTCGGINYSHWENYLAFKEVKKINTQRNSTSGRVSVTFQLANSRYRVLTINFNEGASSDLAEILFKYLSRKKPQDSESP